MVVFAPLRLECLVEQQARQTHCVAIDDYAITPPTPSPLGRITCVRDRPSRAAGERRTALPASPSLALAFSADAFY